MSLTSQTELVELPGDAHLSYGDARAPVMLDCAALKRVVVPVDYSRKPLPTMKFMLVCMLLASTASLSPLADSNDADMAMLESLADGLHVDAALIENTAVATLENVQEQVGNPNNLNTMTRFVRLQSAQAHLLCGLQSKIRTSQVVGAKEVASSAAIATTKKTEAVTPSSGAPTARDALQSSAAAHSIKRHDFLHDDLRS